jgi:hypothetical protein
MSMRRALSVGAAALSGLVVSAPLVLLATPFWVIRALTASIARRLEGRLTPWSDLIAFDPVLGWRPKPDLCVRYLAPSDVFTCRTDAEGWSGRAPLDACELVAVGDSYAFGFSVNHGAAFVDLVPGVRVKGIGAPGYNMVQQLLVMRQLSSRLRGKLVVWFVYLGNDLCDNLSPGGSGYRAPFVRESKDGGAWEIASEHLDRSRWTASVYRPFSHDLHRPSRLADRAHAACEFLIAEGLRVCRDAGARLVVVTIPSPPQYALDALEPGLDADLPDRRLDEICRRLGVPFLPLKAHLDRRDYRDGDDHWNERGHRRVAGIMRTLYEQYAGGLLDTAAAGVGAPAAAGSRRLVSMRRVGRAVP